MFSNPRISSILNAVHLEKEITGIPSFDLSQLELATELDFELPTNLRLGHLAETIVGHLIKSATNYKLLYENIQLIENKKTLGELDFIIQDERTKQIIHLEFAYKFYLYDPTISSAPINTWIGPNRNDSLVEKLAKVKTKQFPLLYHDVAKSMIHDIDITKVDQALCLVASLFIPRDYKGKFEANYSTAIKGYYLNIDKFLNQDHANKQYYLPTKTEWGIDPSVNKNWFTFPEMEATLKRSMQEKQAVLCWEKSQETHKSFFVNWW